MGYGLSGYYSRALILRHAGAFASFATGLDRSHAYWVLFWLPVIATCLNAFAMVRWWMLIFAGRPRDRRLYNHAREAPTLLWPMAILAVMTILAGGWLGIDDILNSTVIEAREGARRVAEAGYPQRLAASKTVFYAVWPSGEDSEDGQRVDISDVATPADSVPLQQALGAGGAVARRWLAVALALGIALAAGVYLPGPRVSERLLRIAPVRWVHTWLRNRMYFEEFYDSVFATLDTGLANSVGWLDRNIVRALSRMLPGS